MIDKSQLIPSKHTLLDAQICPVVIGICVPLFAAFTIYYEKGNEFVALLKTMIPQVCFHTVQFL